MFYAFAITRIFVVVIAVAGPERHADRTAIVSKFVLGVLLRFEQRRFRSLLLLGLGLALPLLRVVKELGLRRDVFGRVPREFMG